MDCMAVLRWPLFALFLVLLLIGAVALLPLLLSLLLLDVVAIALLPGLLFSMPPL